MYQSQRINRALLNLPLIVQSDRRMSVHRSSAPPNITRLQESGIILNEVPYVVKYNDCMLVAHMHTATAKHTMLIRHMRKVAEPRTPRRRFLQSRQQLDRLAALSGCFITQSPVRFIFIHISSLSKLTSCASSLNLDSSQHLRLHG
jgi:hypothetical protein